MCLSRNFGDSPASRSCFCNNMGFSSNRRHLSIPLDLTNMAYCRWSWNILYFFKAAYLPFIRIIEGNDEVFIHTGKSWRHVSVEVTLNPLKDSVSWPDSPSAYSLNVVTSVSAVIYVQDDLIFAVAKANSTNTYRKRRRIRLWWMKWWSGWSIRGGKKIIETGFSMFRWLWSFEWCAGRRCR